MSGHRLKFGVFKISLLLDLILANPDDVKTFTNDLFYWVKQAKLHTYADDHQLYASSVDP